MPHSDLYHGISYLGMVISNLFYFLIFVCANPTIKEKQLYLESLTNAYYRHFVVKRLEKSFFTNMPYANHYEVENMFAMFHAGVEPATNL